MIEPDILSQKIYELKDWQTVAWRWVADPLVTAFERREIRNHIKDSNAELRPLNVEMSAIASQNLSSDYLLEDCARKHSQTHANAGIAVAPISGWSVLVRIP